MVAIRIFVQMLTGRTIELDVDPSSETVHEVKTKFQEKEGVPPAQQRFIFAGRQLEDNRMLSYYNVRDGTVLHFTLRLLGMISTFTSNNQSDTLVYYLLLTQQQRQTIPVPLQALQEKARAQNADPFRSFSFQQDGGILLPEQCNLLCSFLDHMWTATPDASVDLRLVVSNELFDQLLGSLDSQVPSINQAMRVRETSKLEWAFKQVPGHRQGSKIALRMTRGPTNACINFHCDGEYATSTTQIALNDPSGYEGGRLCFFVNDTLHFLERPIGSMVQHSPRVLHGVSALTAGDRKSLFVVDICNGLGETGVVTVSEDHVTSFLSSQN